MFATSNAEDRPCVVVFTKMEAEMAHAWCLSAGLSASVGEYVAYVVVLWCPFRADACNTCSDPLFLLSLSRNRNSSGFAKEHLPHVTYLEDVQVWAKMPAARPAAASTPYVTRRVTRSQTNSIPRRRVYVPSRPTHSQPHGTACPHTVASCVQRRRQRGCHVQVPLQDR